jgi:Spy/CpxP family protein refolding chaperone
VIRKAMIVRYAAAMTLSAGLIFAQGTTTPAPGTAAPGPGQWLTHRLDRIGVVLNLTDDQKAQIKTIAENALTQAQALFPQMQQNRQAIQQLIQSGTTGTAFDTQLQGLANTQASLVSQLTVIHAKAMAQAWALLTPDQQQKAGQLIGMFGPHMRGHMGMGGMGMGMGMGARRGPGMHQGPPAPTQ